MTDLVFLLLIFFIIMSLMANNQTPIDLPKPDESLKPVKDPVEATVLITENNQYVVMPGGDMAKPMEFNQIKELAAAAVQKTGKQKLRIADTKRQVTRLFLAFWHWHKLTVGTQFWLTINNRV